LIAALYYNTTNVVQEVIRSFSQYFFKGVGFPQRATVITPIGIATGVGEVPRHPVTETAETLSSTIDVP